MRLHLFAAALLVGVCQLCEAAPPKLRITGIYSDLKYNEETGDLLGMELLVRPGEGDTLHWRALFQIAEGEGPTAVIVDLQPVADHFEFRVPAGGGVPELRFSVRFTAGEAVVTDAAAGVEEHLRRGRSYWE